MVSPTSPPKVKIMGLGNNREVNDSAVGSVGVSDDDRCSLFPSVTQPPSILAEPITPPLFPNPVKNVSDKSEGSVAGVCGLGNLGNTCFMAAGVQCLVATPPLASALMASLPQSGMAPLTRELAHLTQLIWSGDYSALRPTKFKDSLGKHYPQFNDYRQHDCQEFLALLLDGLHEQMNSALAKKDLIIQGDNIGKICDQSKTVNIERENEDGSSYVSKNNMKNDDWNETRCDEAPLLSLPGTSSIKPADNGDATFSFHRKVVSEEEVKIKNIDSDSDDELSKSNLFEVSEYALDTVASLTEDTVSNDSLSEIGSLSVSNIPKEASLNNSFSFPLLNNCTTRSTNLSLSSPNRISHQANESNETNTVCSHMEGQWLKSLEHILKESKTSNVNVLGKESTSQAPNNTLRFDSEKYPRVKDIKKKSDFEHNVLCLSGKRSGFTEIIPHGLDLKRVKLDDDEDNKNRPPSPPSPHKYQEKNIRLEEEMKERCGEAENAWRNHISKNSSVIVSTFQGQLKSQVVCSSCQYISITYEPFMYLSVPLPNTINKQLKISFISKSLEVSEVVLEVNKNDIVQNIKDKLLRTLDLRTKGSVIVIGEVLNHHIAKLLDEGVSVRNINDRNRQIYAFEVVTIANNTLNKIEEQIPVVENKMEDDISSEVTCAICLENKDSSIKKHINCTFLICDICVTSYSAHFRCSNTSMTCPVCRCALSPGVDLIPINSSSVPIRDIKVSLVYRIQEGDDVRLFGHPSLVKVPNICSVEGLHSSIASFIPYKQSFSLKLVDGQGLWCSKCLYAEHCRGCPIDSNTRLNPNDTLAVCLDEAPPDLPPPPTLPLAPPNAKNIVTIYDCINAFSQSEMLDENNPWYCPNCKKNQCATKSLSIWRFPDYLIVYLKRFVFHNHTSTKIEERVEFPLEGLNFPNGYMYDLYACVCHVGGVSAGHYTTYTLHSETGEWHYFNDSFVTKQSPQEKDFSAAYILFYRKRIS